MTTADRNPKKAVGWLLISAAVVAVLAVAFMMPKAPWAARSEAAREADSAKQFRLEHAEGSIDALVARFVEALGSGRRDALRRIRLTEREYRDIVLSGHVEPGAPLRDYPDRVSTYAWQQLDTKSTYYEGALLDQFGKQNYQLKAVEYADGTQDYATYRAHKQLRLTLLDEDGEEVLIQTGSIAEVEGQFKFVSFIVRD